MGGKEEKLDEKGKKSEWRQNLVEKGEREGEKWARREGQARARETRRFAGAGAGQKETDSIPFTYVLSYSSSLHCDIPCHQIS